MNSGRKNYVHIHGAFIRSFRLNDYEYGLFLELQKRYKIETMADTLRHIVDIAVNARGIPLRLYTENRAQEYLQDIAAVERTEGASEALRIVIREIASLHGLHPKPVLDTQRVSN